MAGECPNSEVVGPATSAGRYQKILQSVGAKGFTTKVSQSIDV